MAVGKIRRIVQSHTQRLEITPAIGIVHGFVLARNLTAVSGHLSIRISEHEPGIRQNKANLRGPYKS